MGGRWPADVFVKPLVEHSLRLGADDLVRESLLGPNQARSATWRWLDDAGAPLIEIALQVTRTADAGRVQLDYRPPGGSIDHVRLDVDLESSDVFGRGRRWWFRCPLGWPDGTPCRLRVADLFLPRGYEYFGCRACQRLAYASTLETRRTREGPGRDEARAGRKADRRGRVAATVGPIQMIGEG